MKTSSCPNLNRDRETTSFPNFLTLLQDPEHHDDDTTLNKRPKLDPADHTEDSETSPFNDILSPFVNEIGFSAAPSSVGMFRSESEQEDRTLTNPISVFRSTYSSSVGSNEFSVDSGARSKGPNSNQFGWDQRKFPDSPGIEIPDNEFRCASKMSKSTFNSICSQLSSVDEKGFTLTEVGSVRASRSEVMCCHFSSDGKLLASAGTDEKAVLWSTDTLKAKCTLEGHTSMITDVRFSPNMPRLATSSFDQTVRVWEADNPDYPLRTFAGHSRAVLSLDFHPNKDDLICSCDGDGKIRYWSINNGCCQSVFKGGTTQTRFQPRLGRYLAADAENVVSIFDVETQALRHSLRGHTKPIESVCWDPSGELLASVSEDSVRLWALGSGSEGKSVHELSCNGKIFRSCVFHPSYASLLVIGGYQSLVLWNMSENRTVTLPAHGGLIAELAVSPMTGLVASASHDKFVKLWK